VEKTQTRMFSYKIENSHIHTPNKISATTNITTHKAKEEEQQQQQQQQQQ
jgi:hypothetical protein